MGDGFQLLAKAKGRLTLFFAQGDTWRFLSPVLGERRVASLPQMLSQVGHLEGVGGLVAR